MFLDRPSLLIGLCALALAACTDAGVGLSAEGPAAPEPSAPPPEPDPQAQGVVPSHKARVKFKGGERLVRDLVAGLELPRQGACSELARYDCIKEVHHIALGGVEPYHKAINNPLEVMPVTAAIAADRVALSTCTRRVRIDFDNPDEAVVFTALVRESGPPSADVLTQVATDLYDRLLQRDATDAEIKALVDFHAEVMAETGDDGRRRWAQLACFSVATTLESLFY